MAVPHSGCGALRPISGDVSRVVVSSSTQHRWSFVGWSYGDVYKERRAKQGKMMIAGAARRGGRTRASSSSSFHRTVPAEELTSERSALVNRETVLFLFQLEMDSQQQRAMTYENYDLVKEIRHRRSQVDGALKELQQAKGYGCGARHASKSVQMDLAPEAIRLRAALSEATAQERYDDAAKLRDELLMLEERAAAAELPCSVAQPKFRLGQMIVHNAKGYRGVICGWDLACCESFEWRRQAGVERLPSGVDQVFYHVLVDSSDWPENEEDPPVAYIAEELLAAAALADFGAQEPLVDTSFHHPYAYLMFLGSDGHGNMIPCRQLRDKYCVPRFERYESSESEDEGAYDNDDDGTPPDGSGPGGDKIWGGGPNIPGIDMSSLE